MQLNINEFTVDSLLFPDDLSQEERNQRRSALASFLSEPKEAKSKDLPPNNSLVAIEVDDLLIEEHEFEIKRISNDELSDILRSAPVQTQADTFFPRIRQVNKLFWFLNNLSNKDIKRSLFYFTNEEEVSAMFYLLIEAAIFFGYIEKIVNEAGENYLMPTEMYDELMDASIENQYRKFIRALGSNESISESIIVQLNDPIFDSISRQMVLKVLADDETIKSEGLNQTEIKKLIDNLRYWYLGIKKLVLEV